MTVIEALEKYKYEMIEIITNDFDEVKLASYWLNDERLIPYLDKQFALTLLKCNCSYDVIFDLRGK